MQLIVMGTLIAFDHREKTSEENEENIKEANKSFISMKGNLDI